MEIFIRVAQDVRDENKLLTLFCDYEQLQQFIIVADASED